MPHCPCPTRATHHVLGVLSTTVPLCHHLIHHPTWIEWGSGSHPHPVHGVTSENFQLKVTSKDYWGQLPEHFRSDTKLKHVIKGTVQMPLMH